ncbi:MAG: glycine/sarcosine/betaine reductase component B subunit [Acidimicrobiia bacterium]|nr:glycine/sarcosine/betaine reductase component B subunit [Acidimicrobiia bacterium]
MRQPFRLDVHTVDIDDIRFGDTTTVDGSTLVVSIEEVAGLVLADPRIAAVDVEIAQPGDDVRIIGCLDAVEPRTKIGEGSVFPGFLGGMETVGTGETLRLGGVSVLASSRYPQPFSGLLQAREAVVDMSGPTSNLSPFGRVRNVVLAYTPNPDIENEDYDDAIRRSNLKVADFLARCALDAPRSSTTTFDFSEQDPDLPNVVYFYQLQGQGQMADTYIYGKVIHNQVPTLMHPNEALDGALVCGVYVYGCYKNVTYLHQNNPIIWEMQARHGKDLNFAGVIINRGHNYTQEEKERSSRWAAKLAAFLEADGAVFTAEGGGNSAIDMMLAVQYMEQAGIKSSVVSSEAAGADGYDFPLFYTVPEADAIVSVGSEDEIFEMPKVAKVIGGDTLEGLGLAAEGPYALKMYFQFCGTQQIGGNVLVGREH